MDALAEFVKGLDDVASAPRALPFTLEVDATAGTRVADVALLLGLIALFWGVGRLLKSAGMPRLRPFVVASGLTGILLLFLSNSAFWMVAGLSVDADKVTLESHLGDGDTFLWKDLRAVELDSGKLFPAFTDDTSLVLVGPDDQRLAIPRFIPGVGAIVPEVRRHLPGAAP